MESIGDFKSICFTQRSCKSQRGLLFLVYAVGRDLGFLQKILLFFYLCSQFRSNLNDDLQEPIVSACLMKTVKNITWWDTGSRKNNLSQNCLWNVFEIGKEILQ